MSPVVPLEPWQTAWPALPALLMLLVGLWGLRERPDRRLWAVLGLALLVRVVGMPVERHEFDGHEAEYLDLFLGVRPLSRGGTLLYPAMQWLSRGLGVVFAPHAGALLVFSVAMGLVSIAALHALVRRGCGDGPALVAATALALWGNHAFWSLSAYNVILPHALSLVALAALARGATGDRAVWAGLAAGGAAALAVATRVESLLVAPAGLLLLLLNARKGAWRMIPGLIAGAALGGVAAQLVLSAGQMPGAEQRALAWSINKGLLVYFAPFDHPALLALALLGLVLGVLHAPRLYLPLAVLVALGHLGGATFDDYGFRHVLTAEAGLAALVGGLALRRWSAPGLLAVAVGLVLHTADVRARFYADEDHLAQAVAGRPTLDWDEVRACTLICEDSRVVPEEEQKSHFNLLDPDEFKRLEQAKGCVYWLYGVQDHRWSSRAVRDRALRLERLYDMEVRGVVQDPEHGYVALVLEPLRRRAPSPLSTPRLRSWRE